MSTMTRPPRPAPPKGRRRWPRRRRLILLVMAALLMVPTVSFAQAMTYPGSAPASVRAVEWVRDHGGGGLVDRVETWLYSRNPPPTGGGPQDQLASKPGRLSTQAPPSAGATTTGNGPSPVTTILTAMPGEGRWHVASTTTTGAPALYTSWFRPDPGHTPVTVAAALIPQSVDAIALNPGTREPVPGAVPTDAAQVPIAARAKLVATFNAGFKMKDSGGGWYSRGRELVTLRPGLASLVIDTKGRATVGAWGQDVSMRPEVAAVRQNLHLIVTSGRPVPGLASNNQGLYGTGKNQFQYTWRSGIGINAQGDLVYVAGKGLTLSTLAHAMAQAHIVTGMELDIHSNMVGFNLFATPGDTANKTSHLLRSMPVPLNRYLVPDQRDFFYITAR